MGLEDQVEGEGLRRDQKKYKGHRERRRQPRGDEPGAHSQAKQQQGTYGWDIS